MSGLFADMKTDGLEESGDRLGGFQVLDSDIYTGPIKMAYAGQSASGARNITLIVDHEGKEYRETIYYTNKAGENFFISKDNKKVPLPGFTTLDNICLVTTGKPLCEQQPEEKVVNVWDADAHKELPKSMPVLTSLLGQVVSLGILKKLENKSVKQGDVYVPTEETREVNNIDVVFHTETKMTVAEARDGKTESAFWGKWSEKNKGQVQDKRVAVAGGVPGKPGSKPVAGPPQAGAPARKSLFGGK
jgi:hypothetical protein